LFLESPVHHAVEVLRGGEVGAEGLLDDHAGPETFRRAVEPRFLEVLEDVVEEFRRARDVEEAVPLAAALAVDLVQTVGESLVAVRVGELALVVVDVLDEALPDRLVVARSGNLAVLILETLAELGVALL